MKPLTPKQLKLLERAIDEWDSWRDRMLPNLPEIKEHDREVAKARKVLAQLTEESRAERSTKPRPVSPQ